MKPYIYIVPRGRCLAIIKQQRNKEAPGQSPEEQQINEIHLTQTTLQLYQHTCTRGCARFEQQKTLLLKWNVRPLTFHCTAADSRSSTSGTVAVQSRADMHNKSRRNLKMSLTETGW